MSHAGSRLLADLADKATLTAELAGVLAVGERRVNTAADYEKLLDEALRRTPDAQSRSMESLPRKDGYRPPDRRERGPFHMDPEG